MKIHPTAIVDLSAELADDVQIGPYSIIEGNVQIGAGTIIDSHAHIYAGARIGSGARVHHCAVIANVPQDLKFHGEDSVAIIGDNTVVREFVTIHRGTEATGKTVIGKNCFVMAYAHVAHDCVIGDNVILVNAVNVAGHVHIEDWVIIGGVVPVHQFVRIGCHSMIGGGYRIAKDVPPYILAAGEPLEYGGLNSIGLRRRGFSASILRELKEAYRLIYKSNLNVSQALEKIKGNGNIISEVANVVDFIENSERGIIG